jgi:very-short-patch-repair endonuclease
MLNHSVTKCVNTRARCAIPLPSRRGGLGRGKLVFTGAMVTTRTQLARQLRLRATDAERRLWRAIRGEQLGVKFRRQFPLGPYIVDFISLTARIIVEVDGGQHANNRQDVERDRFAESQGFTVLRFWNNDVLLNTASVVDTIARCVPQKLKHETLPLPNPPLQERRGQSALSAHSKPIP